MAKTKRRQLAALAAQGELKGLDSGKERTSSSDKWGLSGIPSLDDPMVEIRTQRIIFKIPALPSKAASDTLQIPAVAKKEMLRKRRRRNPQKDMGFSSEQVPADEAKISKAIFQLGKWKRHQRIADLLPSVAKVPSSSRLANGNQKSLVAESMVSNQHSNCRELQISLAKAPGPVRQSKTRMNLTKGSRKSLKLQEVLVRSCAEENKAVDTHCRHNGMRRAPTRLVTSDHSSRDVLFTDINRSQDTEKACNGDVASSIAHPSASHKRCGDSRQKIPRVPVTSKAAVLLHQKTQKQAGLATSEAITVEGFQGLHHEKNVTQQNENFGRTTVEDIALVRIAADGEAIHTTQDQLRIEHQNARNPERSSLETELMGNVRLTGNSSRHDLVHYSEHFAYHICPQLGPQEDLTQQLQTKSSAPGKQGMFLVTANREINLGPSAYSSAGRSTIFRGAELIKQERKLAMMKKRLEAAGGLRKWLFDKGLGQIVPILQNTNIDDLSLLQLTMEGLKSIGLIQVGPRRKLIHAVRSLTLPSFSKAL